mmetsp:Transcript_14218/g.29011  ORF Transcript_14218/g.29011 Transcript_14218/m.29011 type:complete len:1199 (-) Transcript_14218:40-3636(-)
MFPPSTFPTMSLGSPANLTSNTTPSQQQPPPPPANVNSVLTAIRNSSSPNNTIRHPSERVLQQWSDSYLHHYACNYLTSLLYIIDWESSTAGNAAGVVEESSRLMAAILFKNCVPKAFSVPIDSLLEEITTNDNDTNALRVFIDQLRHERNVIRQTLPNLLFRGARTDSSNNNDKTLMLHLQLALSNIALFDFPTGWPTLLEELMHVVKNGSGGATAIRGDNDTGMIMIVRVRAIQALRMCLSSIRHRKIVVQKGRGGGRRGGGGRQQQQHPMMDMRHLESMIGKAVHERKEVHRMACNIFDGLAEGIVQHAQLAVTGGSSSSGVGQEGDATCTAWQMECKLATQYIKCMTEVIPMLEIEQVVHSDPRVPAVRSLLDNLTQICEAVKAYPFGSTPSTLMGVSSIQQEMTIQMDKLYRATLTCCMNSMKYQPQLFATQITAVLPSVVEPILTLDEAVLQSMPVKRLIVMTSFIQMVLQCALYDERRKDRLGSKNAVLSMLMGRKGGGSGNDESGDGSNPNNDPAVIAARETVTALLAEGTIERLIECIVGKFLMLHPDEVEEWESDPEGRYETDLAEEAMLDAASPRHCGGALLMTLMNVETDRVAKTLLDLTQRVFQQLPQDDVNSMLSREACYRALELCHNSMIAKGKRRLNFSDWFQAELLPILQTELAENSPVAMRAMQARAVTLTQAYACSLKGEEFDAAFQSIAKLMAAPDLVTALCASRCIDYLAILSVQERESGEDSPQLLAVRSHSVFALGNAFALANRAESEECLRVILMCVSALVEANGVYLEPVLQAIAEQLPPLWERAGDSVPIHSCLLSVLTHLIMKMGYSTVENCHVQAVLFPLLDYCTDINVVNRAETLLEDGLRLWLVTLLSSRVATMGSKLTSMLPRLEMILRSGLEPHLSLKVLQFNSILLGKQVVEPLADFLRELLVTLTSRVHVKAKGNGDEMEDDGGNGGVGSKEKDVGTMRDAIAALSFADILMQLFPDLGYNISSPSIGKVISYICSGSENGQRLSVTMPLLEVSLSAFGRMVWINPNSFDEVFTQQNADPSQREMKIVALVKTWLGVVTSVSLATMISKKAQTIRFIDQKGTALSLCSAICRSPTLSRVAGADIVEFTRQLLEVEARGNISTETIVEVACGATRQVVGDGPLGDAANMTAEMLKLDPLLTVSLKEALDNAEKAVAMSSSQNSIM